MSSRPARYATLVEDGVLTPRKILASALTQPASSCELCDIKPPRLTAESPLGLIEDEGVVEAQELGAAWLKTVKASAGRK